MQRKPKAPVVIDLIDDDFETPSNDCLVVCEPVNARKLYDECAKQELDAQAWIKARPSPKYARRDALQQSIKALRQALKQNEAQISLVRQEEAQALKRLQLAQMVLAQVKGDVERCQRRTKEVEMEQRDIQAWQPRLRQAAFEVDEVQSSQESCYSSETQEYMVAPVVTPTPQELEFLDSLPWEL